MANQVKVFKVQVKTGGRTSWPYGPRSSSGLRSNWRPTGWRRVGAHHAQSPPWSDTPHPGRVTTHPLSPDWIVVNRPTGKILSPLTHNRLSGAVWNILYVAAIKYLIRTTSNTRSAD